MKNSKNVKMSKKNLIFLKQNKGTVILHEETQVALIVAKRANDYNTPLRKNLIAYYYI